jgi:hypothetical protein
MQTDTWLNDTSYPDCCPLCSQPLYGSQKCPSCGFIAHEPTRSSAPAALSSSAREGTGKQPNPVTPIPARASAVQSHPHALPGTSRPGTGRKTPDPESDALPNWLVGSPSYESPNYEAASSLPALSLIIAETPTAPPRPELPRPRKTARLEAEQEQIAEIDTLPPALVAQITPARPATSEKHDRSASERVPARPASGQSRLIAQRDRSVQPALAGIDEFDTMPPLNGTSVRPVETARPSRSAKTSQTSSRLAASSRKQSYRHTPPPRKGFHPLDSFRWWLLRPGHIEFLLWVTGSLLLFSITFFLLLATTLSLLMPGTTTSSGNLRNSTISSTATVQSTAGQSLTPQATHAQPVPTASTPRTSAPTVGATPAPETTPSLGNALNTSTDNSLISRLLHLNPLIWLVVACYLLSLVLLILAGRLRRSRPSKKVAPGGARVIR